MDEDLLVLRRKIENVAYSKVEHREPEAALVCIVCWISASDCDPSEMMQYETLTPAEGLFLEE